jgi:hypothetical protein
MITVKGQVYDGVMDKPSLDEYIEHLDHKYISKHKGKNGKWIYKYKSKIKEKLTKVGRAITFRDNRDITNGGEGIYKQGYARWWNDRKTAYKINAEGSGKANFLSGQTGSKNVKTTKVNSKKKKKK